MSKKSSLPDLDAYLNAPTGRGAQEYFGDRGKISEEIYNYYSTPMTGQGKPTNLTAEQIKAMNQEHLIVQEGQYKVLNLPHSRRVALIHVHRPQLCSDGNYW